MSCSFRRPLARPHRLDRQADAPGRVVASARRVVAGAGLAVIATLALGPVASADVNLSPAQADQGSAAAITLQVRNDRPGVFTKKVEVKFPTEAPIAEIYPMSVDNWAPVSTTEESDVPLQGVHNSGLTTITTAVTWVRAENAPKAPAVENLRVELGPLPTSPELALTVIQTYSDGTSETFNGPSADGSGTVLKLTAPAAAAAAPEAEEDVAPAATDDGAGAELGLIGAGIIGGLLIGALVMVTIGNRNRTGQIDDDIEEDLIDPATRATTLGAPETVGPLPASGAPTHTDATTVPATSTPATSTPEPATQPDVTTKPDVDAHA